ncbi:hypothetical protein Btru_061956 [Bulinus truncatus]|nr:hypothetical protein Btru_061956 [Bulinus truncatus]
MLDVSDFCLRSMTLALNDSVDKGVDPQKLQIIITDSAIQPAGVTQKLFDSKVTFADLVRVCSTQESGQQTSKAQLGNTLLSTAHASTLVSNYLNTYRSYLDQLRKTCGRGDSLGEAISLRTCTNSTPLVLPLTRMTPVFSDDSREDPEFLELLKKTTTESIRKLWPHPNKTNIVRTAGLVDVSDKVDGFVPMTVNTSDNNSLTEDKSEQESDDSPLASSSDNSADYKNDTSDSSEDTTSTNCGQCNPFENTNLLTESDTIDPNSNTAMKSNGEQLLLSDGGSANVISKSSAGPMQKGLLKVPNESLTSGDSYFRHSNETSGQLSGQSNWNDATQHKCPNDQLNQQMKTASLDSFLKHQQKLMQQQQLQRQILQHQQQQHRQQQQQMMEQYQQQEQQQRQQSANKVYGFQASEPNKNWFPSMEDSGTSSPRSRLASNSQLTTTYNPMTSGHVGIDVFNNGNQTSQDYFPSNNKVQGISVLGSYVENQSSSNYGELSSNSRTLKASYACLDPSNPMTLSVAPFNEYNHERDNFIHNNDRQMTFPHSTEEKNCSNSSRSWAEMSRAAYENESLTATSKAGYENDSLFGTSSTGSALEDRLRRAYARSRITQLSQPSEASRQSTVQRPILKVDNSSEMGVYTGQSSRCGFDSTIKTTMDGAFENGNRNNLESGYDEISNRYRWNSLTNCSAPSEAIDNTCLTSSCSSLRGDSDDTFMNMQPSTGLEQTSRVSRLYQWKQSLPTTNDINYMQTSRAMTDNSRMSSSDSIANSLLSNLQSDRDFSWNASSMSSPMSSMSQNVDQQVFGGSTMSGQYMFSDAYLNKVSSYNMEQRRLMTNTNMANASGTNPNQSESAEESNLFYEAEDARQNTWSV